MSVWVFSRYSASSHILKLYTLGELACLNCPNLGEHGCVLNDPVMEWCPVKVAVSKNIDEVK